MARFAIITTEITTFHYARKPSIKTIYLLYVCIYFWKIVRGRNTFIKIPNTKIEKQILFRKPNYHGFTLRCCIPCRNNDDDYSILADRIEIQQIGWHVSIATKMIFYINIGCTYIQLKVSHYNENSFIHVRNIVMLIYY